MNPVIGAAMRSPFWRAIIAVFAIATIAMLVAACSPSAEPTAVPPTATATNTPEPTAVPAPTGTIDDLAFADGATLRNVAAYLSESEVTCIRAALGDEFYESGLDPAFIAIEETSPEFFIECLEPENAIGITTAFLSAESVGLRAETRSCMRDILRENPNAMGLGTEPSPEEMPALIRAGVQMQLCMTEEEAAASAAAIGGGNAAEMPSPEVQQCITEKLSSLDDFIAILTGENTDPEAGLAFFVAAIECGLETPEQQNEVSPFPTTTP